MALVNLLFFMPQAIAQTQGEEVTFEITGFLITGNTVLSEDGLMEVLKEFTGPEMTAEDVEKARDALEKRYHESGYPTVIVNIPEQTVEEGLVELAVVESKIRKVKVTGNRYFTMEKIRRDLPSFREGAILYVPEIQQELIDINRNPDFKVAPVILPAQELGLIDVELKVIDRLPLHGSLEMNNRAPHDTTDLRFNGQIRYDNLWQKEHSISLQYQTSPQDLEEVQVVAGSYVLPAPWNDNHALALYGIYSQSDTAFGQGFTVLGKGILMGARYVLPLPAHGLYAHNLTVGLDYKDFDEETGFTGQEDLKTPITYLPLSFSYSSSLPDSWGTTQMSGGVHMSFRGLVSDQREFEIKRFKAGANYFYFTAGVERTQKLPYKFGLFLKLDGQIADQPLISNEQYAAGGMVSVRGYREVEVLGDSAFHGVVELSSPEMAGLLGFGDKVQCKPFLFYDFARVGIKDPLPGQDQSTSISGTGFGVRGTIMKSLEYEMDVAVALEDTDRTDSGETRVYFMMRYTF
jgi:hemolysin activation/secretion protein